MAAQNRLQVDPSVRTFMLTVCRDVVAAHQFCKNEGIINNLEDVACRQALGAQNRPACLLTVGCTGQLKEVPRSNRGKVRMVYRCGTCKKERSVMTATGILAGNPVVGEGSFFANLDIFGRNQRKLPLDVALQILYFWSKDVPQGKMKLLLCEELGQRNDMTLVDWCNYLGQVLVKKFAQRTPMGAPVALCGLMKASFEGAEKTTEGGGNRAPPAAQNCGNQVIGPWVFELVCRSPNGSIECRVFHVLCRDIPTLRPIVQYNVAAASEVWSNEWRAYTNLAGWGNYTHRTVNHSIQFVDPITGVNTQLIERQWGTLRLKIVKCMRGFGNASADIIAGHMAEFLWRGLNGQSANPFVALLQTIRDIHPA